MSKNSRVDKALEYLGLEEVWEVSDKKDFVEVVGGGDCYLNRYQVYFDKDNNISYVRGRRGRG